MPHPATGRTDWVDHARGLCIVLVVMMHSTLGVEAALGEQGVLHGFIDWARPFRMPDFFLISGLFLARRIDAPWRVFLDRKVVHFVYFYLLWMTIQFGFRAPGLWSEAGPVGLARFWFAALVEPFGTLWFIYLLPLIFLATRALRTAPPALVFVFAAALEMAHVHTGWTVIDEFAARYVYFFAGYWLSASVFRFAEALGAAPLRAVLVALALWAAGHTLALEAGLAAQPGGGLALGFAGAAAIVASAVTLTRLPVGAVFGRLGRDSISIFLAFFLFMAATRMFAVWLAPELGPDVIAVLVTTAGVIGPLLLAAATRGTALGWLFRRPDSARLDWWTTGWPASHERRRRPRLRPG